MVGTAGIPERHIRTQLISSKTEDAYLATMDKIPQISKSKPGSDLALPRFTQGLPDIMRKRSKTRTKFRASSFVHPNTIEKRISKAITQKLRYYQVPIRVFPERSKIGVITLAPNPPAETHYIKHPNLIQHPDHPK